MSTTTTPAEPRPTPTGRPSVLQAWAGLVYRRRVSILVAWACLLAAGAAALSMLSGAVDLPDYTINSSDSARTNSILAKQFPQFGDEQNAVVLLTPTPSAGTDPVFRGIVERVASRMSVDSTVRSVTTPYTQFTSDQISRDGHAALLVIAVQGSPRERADGAERIQDELDRAVTNTPFTAMLTGQTPLNTALTHVEERDQRIAELVGLPLAFLVLLVTLRTVVAAMVPLLSAAAGILAGSIPLLALADVMNLDTFALVVATVLGLGVGIDYALFITSRFQEEVDDGESPAAALQRSMQTSGRTVVTAGVIVIIALGSLALIDGHLFVELAVVSGLTVLVTMLTSVTALPALLAVLGGRINHLRVRRVPHRRADDTGVLGRWARRVMRRPLRYAIPAAAVLILCSIPLGSARLGLDLGFTALQDTAAGRAQSEIAERFGPGTVSPIQVVACARSGWDDDGLRRLGSLSDQIRSDDRAASVTSLISLLDATPAGRTAAHLTTLRSSLATAPVVSAVTDRTGQCGIVIVAPASAVDSPAALALVDSIRGLQQSTGLSVNVGGMTAQYRDLADETASKLPLVVLAVVVVSFLYLVVAFRSIVLPLKAAVLNLLATAASIGLTIALFQFGWAEELFDFTSVGTVQAFLPVALFAILFGLSMDYEVLLVGRIREEYLSTGDLTRAVARTLDAGGRQVTAAATIMAAVFGSLVLADVLELKQLGFGLAAAVVIDATIVRMVLVPAAMVAMRTANWWLPRWLDTRLPRLQHH